MEHLPILIVGSGPAGTATALHLARIDPLLARDVLLIEKARHPRHKVCAGGLIPHALDCLHELDLDLTVPHVTVHRAQVSTPSLTVRHDDHNLCYVIRRNELDAMLAGACRARGIRIQEDEDVIDLRREGGAVCIETTRAAYRAQIVIGADGSGSVVRRRMFGAGKEYLARAIMADVPAEGSRWDGFAAGRYDFDFRVVAEGIAGYRWAFPCLIDGKPHINVGAYAMSPIGARLDRSLEDYMAEIGGSARRQAFPIRWFGPRTRIAAERVLLVGDAAGVDPLMGEGISLAMEYGKLAAAAAARMLAGKDFSGSEYTRAVEGSWLGKKLRRLHLGTRLFYGPAWRLWFALPAHSARVRALGLRWYNGVDNWDRRSGWEAIVALVRNDFAERRAA